jgi:FkbM family methyltransferase
VKKKLYSLLPNALKTRIKQQYYWKKFQNASPEDEKDLKLISLILKKGNHAIDVGANYGAFSKEIALQIGVEGKLLSMEPVEETYNVLKNNLSRANFKQAIPLRLAASDKPGEAILNIPKYPDGSTNFYSASIQNTPDSQQLTIQCETLDILCQKYNLRPDFIKIDVEGHEPAVLRGALKTISEYNPILLLEVNDGFFPASIGEEVKVFLEKLGYTMHVFNGIKLEPAAEKGNNVNFVFLPDK